MILHETTVLFLELPSEIGLVVTLVIRGGSLMIGLTVGHIERVVLHEHMIVATRVTHTLLTRARVERCLLVRLAAFAQVCLVVLMDSLAAGAH